MHHVPIQYWCIMCRYYTGASFANTLLVHHLPIQYRCIICQNNTDATFAKTVQVHHVPILYWCIICQNNTDASFADTIQVTYGVYIRFWPTLLMINPPDLTIFYILSASPASLGRFVVFLCPGAATAAADLPSNLPRHKKRDSLRRPLLLCDACESNGD